jgi:hypothetical protein
MNEALHKLCTAFDGPFHLTSGSLRDVALAVKGAIQNGAAGPVLIFDDGTGEVIDLDLRGTGQEPLARLAQADPATSEQTMAPRGPGRPRLGVVAREVTLLPRHWAWLGAQPGGASVALRKLVEEARRSNAGRDRQREAQEAAYRFMAAMAGDLPGFEEAARALFANDRQRFGQHIAAWPHDISTYVAKLAFGDDGQDATAGDGHD